MRRAKGESAATADDIIGAYEQIIERARARGIRVYGATIMPFEGFSYAGYFTPESEADRQKVNAVDPHERPVRRGDRLRRADPGS